MPVSIYATTPLSGRRACRRIFAVPPQRGGRWVARRVTSLSLFTQSGEASNRTNESQYFRMNSASERPIWRVRGRPGQPLRKGRSNSRVSRRTATRRRPDGLGCPQWSRILRAACRAAPARGTARPLGSGSWASACILGTGVRCGVATHAGASSHPQEARAPLPTGPHGRGPGPDTHGAVHGARDPRLITRPPRGACVAVTPNLVWIAQVGDCVQVLHDRGHVLAHEAEDVVTEVGMVPREHGLLMAGSGCGRPFT